MLSIDQFKHYAVRVGITGIVCTIIFFVTWFVVHRNDFGGAVVSDQSNIPSHDVVLSDLMDPFPNDKDRDGIEDIKEQELGLSDVLPDTDVDGLQDNDELSIWKTDPLKFDTDGDGYGDGWEVLKGYNPTGTGPLVQ